MPVALELRGATKRYPGGVLALRGVDLGVRAGERACLLGPNGAGKTTIVRLLEGALTPTTGSARVLDVDCASPAYAKVRRSVGIVPQTPGMYEDLRLREYLELVRRLYGCESAFATAGPLGLSPYLDRMMAALSGGLQRRAVLAAALLAEPEVLILDEPTAGLDPVAARDVREVLRQAMGGRTVLFCTHNLAEAEALCESVIILRAGQMLLHEPLERLRARLGLRVRLRARQGPAALAAALQASGHSPFEPSQADEDGAGVEIAASDPEALVPELLRTLLTQDIDVYEARIVRPTLEAAFFQAMEVPARSGSEGSEAAR